MTDQSWQQVWELFHAVLERPADQRSAFLDEACGSDGDVRKRVEELIEAHEGADAFMETPAILSAEPEPDIAGQHDFRPGDRIAAYRVLRSIGEGGMGVVYEAEQEEPVRRRVAMKVIKLGMDTRRVVARFEAELQTLAMMNHSNIAKVLDAGATESGRPYFVMEYVAGIPITEYCDRYRLTTRERLEVFLSVCEGIHHAHRKGIIHRDLKPSNVLVTIEGNQPVPKITDFGIAKAVSDSPAQQTVYTEVGLILGTPDYMSPEQIEVTGLDMDTRSDVYSLAVMLYRMLTGVAPFDIPASGAAGQANLQRTISSKSPVRLSTRLNQLDGDVVDEIADNRNTTTGALKRELEGDLEWITLKGMERDRLRRYDTAAELAADIRRYLGNQPVMARAPSVTYRMRKFTARHKVGVTLSGALLLVAIAFSVTMTVQSIRLQKSLDETVLERARSEQVSNFVLDLFALPDPSVPKGEDLRVMDVLDKGALDISNQLDDQPELKAAMLLTIGRVYRKLALYDQAERMLSEALQIQHTALTDDEQTHVTILSSLGELMHDRGEYENAERHYREALEIARGAPNRAKNVGGILNNLAVLSKERGAYEDAESFGVEALQNLREGYGAESTQVAQMLLDLGGLYYTTGDFDAAEPLLGDALALNRKLRGNDHPAIATSLNHYANLAKVKGDLSLAEDRLTEALRIYRHTHGNAHSFTAITLINLAGVMIRRGKYDEAARAADEAISINEALFDAAGPHVATSKYTLAVVRMSQGDYVAAERQFRAVLALDRGTLGNEHPDVALDINYLSTVLRQLGEYDKAVQLHREALEMLRKTIKEAHPRVATTYLQLGLALAARRDYPGALTAIGKSLAISRELFGEKHTAVADSLYALGVTLRLQGEYAESQTHHESALHLRRELQDEHPDVAASLHDLAAVYALRSDTEASEIFYGHALELRRKLLPANHPDLAYSLAGLGTLLTMLDRPAEGEPRLREALNILTSSLPATHWRRAEVASALGECLTKQRRYADAEPLLVSGYETINAARGESGAESRRALERLVALYDSSGRSDKASSYRTRLPKNPSP